MLHLYVFYFFITCSIGIFSLGITITAYLKAKDRLVQAYLSFYIVFTMSIFLNAFFSYIETNVHTIAPQIIASMDYLDIVTLHLLIFLVPFFTHEFFQVSHQKLRNTLAAILALTSYILLHLWEFINLSTTGELTGFDTTDIVLLVALLYCFIQGLLSFRHILDPVRQRFAKIFLPIFGLCLPFLFYDVIMTMTFSPLFYGAVSMIFNIYFIKHYLHRAPPPPVESTLAIPTDSTPQQGDETIFNEYNFSPREREVLDLLLQGYTNAKIGENLFISINTVKTHISNIYQKVGVKRRYELIAQFADPYLPSKSNES